MVSFFGQRVSVCMRGNISTCFFVCLVFVLGIAVGALAVKTLSDSQKVELLGILKIFFNSLVQNGENSELNMVSLGTMLGNNSKIILLIWALGFTIIGVPFILFIIFTRGFIIGFSVGFLVNEYVLGGIIFAVVSILPHNFFAIPAILVTAIFAITFSSMLLRQKFAVRNVLIYESMVYSVICFIMLMVILFSTLIENYISPVFMKMVASWFLKDAGV